MEDLKLNETVKSTQSGKPSPFAGHRQRGRRHVPPFLDLPVEMTLRSFAKMAFPDMLWLLTMLRLRPLSQGRGPATFALDIGQDLLRNAHGRGALGTEREPVFQGLLTQWELIPELERSEFLRRLREQGIYEAVAPESLAHALAAYEEAPGLWLFQPRFDAGFVPDAARAEEHLWETMRLGGDSHQQLATHAIYLWLGMLAKAGRLSFSEDDEGFKHVARYESGLTEHERQIAEATMRASFLSASGPEVAGSAESAAWCEQFWRANGRIFACRWEEDDESGLAPPDRAQAGRIRIFRLHYRFLSAAHAIHPDTWDHDRYDVLTGIAWRILRIAAHVISHPAMWSEEHGYPSVRMLFEGYAQLKWMLAVEDSRPGVWHEFKNYGRGRTKALMLHTKATMERSQGEPSASLRSSYPSSEHRPIGTSAKTSKTSVRRRPSPATSRSSKWRRRLAWRTCISPS
jgi:hypothetical protein